MDAPDHPELPVRPYIPPTALLALGTCSSSAVLLEVGWVRHVGEDVVSWPLAALLTFVGISALTAGVRARHRARGGRRLDVAMTMLGFGLLVGTVSSCAWLFAWQGDARAVRRAGDGTCLLTVKGDPSAGERGFSSTALLLDADSGARLGDCRLTTEACYESGAMLRAVCRFKEFDFSGWARSRFMKGEVGSVRVVSVLMEGTGEAISPIAALRMRALGAIDPGRDDYRALIAGTVCGRTTELNASASQEDFSVCGLTHLVAVSGSHLAYIAVLLERVLRDVGLPHGMQNGVMLLVMASYVAFTGGAPSAVRSVSMVAIAMAAAMGFRRAHAPSGLALAVTALVAVDPGAVYDMGFQLSVLSVLFIVVFGGYVRHHLARLHVPGVVADALSLTLVAQWATLPLTLPQFGELSLVAPLANLIVGPIMSGLLATGLMGVGAAVAADALIAPFGSAGAIAGIALAIPDALARIAVFIARACADIPLSSVPFEAPWFLMPLAYGAALIVYLRWGDVAPRRIIEIGCVVAFLMGGRLVYWTRCAPPEVVILDIGQGDAILIRDGESTLLVDAGIDEATRMALARNHVLHLDGVLITHWDRDHWGGLPYVLKNVEVDHLYVARGAALQVPREVSGGPPIIELAEGDAVRVGSFSCEVVWPDESVEGDENADSVALDVVHEGSEGGLHALLTGDTERDELAEYVEEVGDIDVLKLGHHGSRVSVAKESLAVLRPELAVASAGEGNRYGHPDPMCVDIVKESGARFLCTKDVGDIHVFPDEPFPRYRASR